MKNRSNIKYKLSLRHKILAISQIAVLAVAAILPASLQAAQLENRQLQLSSAASGANNVEYTFTFDATSSDNLGSFVFEVCDNDPFPGTTCDAPTGFNGDGADADVTIEGSPVTSGTVTTTGASENVFTVPLDSVETVNANDTIEVVLSGVTNPTAANTEFWARLYTYSDTGASTLVDDGGLAFSTGQAIDVTARVQETLQFCVYTGVDCQDGGSEVDLGILNTAELQTAESFFDVATNARNGMSVTYLGTTLESGGHEIDPFGPTMTASDTGTEQFGLRVDDMTTPTQGGSIASPFDTAGAGEYSFVEDSQEELATSTAPIAETKYTIEYGANVDALTPTGVYSTSVEFIATATF